MANRWVASDFAAGTAVPASGVTTTGMAVTLYEPTSEERPPALNVSVPFVPPRLKVTFTLPLAPTPSVMLAGLTDPQVTPPVAEHCSP